MKETNAVRREFLEYFKKQGHAVIASSPVLPHDDPTLLFTNAGMNQFKDVFLGKASRDFTRATTSQKCIRAGGKHNDLENVGHTKRHLTFFEMLGNFSFGDYFKEQAICYAWEVSTTVFGFDPERIWPTVYKDDDEAFEIWKKYVPEKRITRFGEKENFWSMGDVGPCGPCSELLYDRGQTFGSCQTPLEDTTGERFLEFWNLVFMQYNKNSDGKLDRLPKPSIDTGAGLERVMSLLQNTDSVFETDILRGLIRAIEAETKIRYDLNDEQRAPAFRVIADHLRTLSFAIADGIQPSNVERGYVLRKILRRAVRYGKILGFEDPFLARLLPALIQEMGQDYKELICAKDRIQEILTVEEEAFFKTLKRGGNILNQIIQTSTQHKKEISGEDAFKLKDTYGLPLEEVLLIAKDNELSVDITRYQALEQEAKEKSRGAQKQTKQLVEENQYEHFVKEHAACLFLRDDKETHESEVIGLVKDGKFVQTLEKGDEGMCILKETLFYPEMGGQVGDSGTLANASCFFEVQDTKSPYKGVITHIGTLDRGSISVGDRLVASIDQKRRQKIANNHTATHLLHWALHEVLGEHARQAGSVVDEMRLRFDFAHHKPITDEEIVAIERKIGEKIRQNTLVKTYEIPYEEAQKRHDIKQFFGEKYGSLVRVVDIDFAKELCGGTHTSSTGTIGYFRIAKESSVAAGIRRIEAVTGELAEAFAYEKETMLKDIALKLKTPESKIAERLDKLQDELKVMGQEVKTLKMQKLQDLASTLSQKATLEPCISCITEVLVRPDELRLLADEIANRLPSAIIGLGCKDNEKAHLFVKVPQALQSKGMHAAELMNAVLPLIEGRGGGKADAATGAGKAKDNLSEALKALGQKVSCSA